MSVLFNNLIEIFFEKTWPNYQIWLEFEYVLICGQPIRQANKLSSSEASFRDYFLRWEPKIFTQWNDVAVKINPLDRYWLFTFTGNYFWANISVKLINEKASRRSIYHCHCVETKFESRPAIWENSTEHNEAQRRVFQGCFGQHGEARLLFIILMLLAGFCVQILNI